MKLLNLSKEQGLTRLAEEEGLTEIELLEQATFDGVSPGICLTCGYTNSVEPDSSEGYCETCKTNTVQSCLILAGLI